MGTTKFRAILICVGLFLFFLVLRFPYRNLRGYVFEQIYKNTAVRVDSRDLYPVFLGWPGVRLRKATARIPLDRNAALSISSDTITARVGLASLIPPALSASLYVEDLEKGGDVYAKGSLDQKHPHGQASMEKVRFDQFLFPGLSDPIQAEVTGSAAYDFRFDDFAKSNLEVNASTPTLTIPPINLSGFIIPKFEMGKVDARIVTKDGAVTIDKFQVGEPSSDFRANLTGRLKLAKTWGASELNLVLRIQTTEKFRRDPNNMTLAILLNSFQTGNVGEYAMKWSATLDKMQYNISSRLPQKL